MAVSSPISDGMVPVSAVFHKFNSSKAVSAPISVGRVPVMCCPPRCKTFNLVSNPKNVGIVPVSSQALRLKRVVAVSSPISLGMVPVMGFCSAFCQFPYKSKLWMAVSNPRCEGMDPVSKFSLNSRSVNLVKDPNSVGTVPLRCKFERDNVLRDLNNPSSEGKVPKRKTVVRDAGTL